MEWRARACATSSGASPSGGAPTECRSEQSVDLVPRLATWHAVAQLKLDEAHQQRIEGSPGGKELLRNLRERQVGGNQRGERGGLAARSLSVSNGGAAITRCREAHGDTKAAPVMPAAACPGRVQMNVCVPG